MARSTEVFKISPTAGHVGQSRKPDLGLQCFRLVLLSGRYFHQRTHSLFTLCIALYSQLNPLRDISLCLMCNMNGGELG